jgi:hypothetical protein
MALIVLPESTTTLRGLYNEVLPEVIRVLEARGYAVDQENAAPATGDYGWLRKFAIQPGPATLTIAANTSDDGSIMVVLHGEKFGQKALYSDNYDEQLYNNLEALGQRLSAAYKLVSTTGDPDFVTGGPGAPGTFLPERHDDGTVT